MSASDVGLSNALYQHKQTEKRQSTTKKNDSLCKPLSIIYAIQLVVVNAVAKCTHDNDSCRYLEMEMDLNCYY